MPSTICTIGFAGKTAEEFFRLLKEAGVQKVIDIRDNRIGQLSGFAKYPDLAFFLERVAGIAYAYEPALAPTPEIRKTYRQDKDWSRYECSFLQLLRDRGFPEQATPSDFEGTVALLCSEPGPEKCHRRLVAELLAQHWRSQGREVEVRHLFFERPPRKPARKRKSATGHEETPDH
ncbi:MAG: DUF488 domain-containing protein [Acidobacteria bacterium]|nr:DUF488 domain-containing protein [Acidobacteriota bacterium]